MLRESRGFTLIELLITVAVMSILAAIGYPSYLRFITRSQAEEAKSIIGSISTAMRIGRQNSGAFNLITLVPAAGNWQSITVGDGIYDVGANRVDTGDAPFFEFMINNVSATTFRVTARGINGGLDNADTVIYNYNTATINCNGFNRRDCWSGTLID